MKIKLLITSLFFLAPQVSQAENQWSIGGGFQNAGLIGVQYGYVDGDQKYYAALGLVGAAVGYEKVVSADRKHALGVVTGIIPAVADYGYLLATYNYHFTGFNESGFQLGLNVGLRRDDGVVLLGPNREPDTKFSLGLSLAYKF